jgi:hypothetical protein
MLESFVYTLSMYATLVVAAWGISLVPPSKRDRTK